MPTHKENLNVTTVDQKTAVCLTSETHFTTESHIKLRGFYVYRTVHPSNCVRGGSAVTIKEEISRHEVTKIEKEEFQVTSVKMKTTSGIITVAATYSPPRHNLQIEDYLNLLQSFSGKFIFGGDFNSKNTHWGSRLTNPKDVNFTMLSKGVTVKYTLQGNQHIGRQIEIRYQI